MLLLEIAGALILIRAVHLAFKWNSQNSHRPAKAAKKSTGVKVGTTIYGG